MSASDEKAVRAAHQAFYRAFESLDIARMEKMWAHEGQVTCVHPGWPIAEGWLAVRHSWDTIFRNTRDIHFDIADEHIDVHGDLAWVTCIERISSGSDQGAIRATNVLRRDVDQWLMVHHHGSPYVPPRPTAASKSSLN